MMNSVLERLAERAGFVFWGNELHMPRPESSIDWSCDYDEELKKYVELIIEEAIEVMVKHDLHGDRLGEKIGIKIKEHFGM